jgi:nucleotide-binding universal stress UspA family protein
MLTTERQLAGAPGHAAEAAEKESRTGPSGTAGAIVVGVDGSWCSLAALRWAAEEGSLRGIPVRVVMAGQMPGISGRSALMLPLGYDLHAEGRRTLDGILREHLGAPSDRPPESPVTSQVVDGSPATTLLEASRDASLLVVGNRGHGGFTPTS